MVRKLPNKGLASSQTKGMLTRRAHGHKFPKPRIIIVCEGKVTEPQYFEDFTDQCANTLVRITTIGGCGVPVSVVERAIVEKQQLTRLARSTKDSYDRQFEVWAVFDRDDHPKPQIPRALRLAQVNDIRVAFSNPCFELWGLMHFSCVARPGSHQDTQRELKRRLPGFCHEKNPILPSQELENRYPRAVTNATRALKARSDEGQEHGDPSTTVHLLTEKIRQFGRIQAHSSRS